MVNKRLLLVVPLLFMALTKASKWWQVLCSLQSARYQKSIFV